MNTQKIKKIWELSIVMAIGVLVTINVTTLIQILFTNSLSLEKYSLLTCADIFMVNYFQTNRWTIVDNGQEEKDEEIRIELHNIATFVTVCIWIMITIFLILINI